MAKRPVYIPRTDRPGVIVKNIEFQWFPGFSRHQKQKSIRSLHESAKNAGISPVLEISTKSDSPVGVSLSAFNLMFPVGKKMVPLEAVFQSSKVFEKGGPYIDLLDKSPWEIKRDKRLRESGKLVGFRFLSLEFPTRPLTLFYDWLYINAVSIHKHSDKLVSYAGFTDIEFNPKKSVNCQAYSAALYVSLKITGFLQDALKSIDDLQRILKEEYAERDREAFQQALIS